MSATVIQGYGVESKKIDMEITRKTVNFLKLRPRPIQFGSSAPVIELLAGRKDLAAVESCVKKQKAELPEFDDEKALGLVIPDLDHPELGAVAFRIPVEGDVIPAVILRASGSVWIAEACAFKTEFLASFMIAKFNSASVAALLDLSCAAFRKVLIASHMAASRLIYTRDTNDGFLPVVPDKRKWTIASHWPDWRRQEFKYKACIYALSVLETLPKIDYSPFVKKLERLGLSIEDITDCPFVEQ